MQIKCDLPLTPGEYVDIVKEGENWTVQYTGATQKKPVPLKTTIAMQKLGRTQYKGIYEVGGWITVIRFADLHRHSDCSLMDGLSKIPDIVKKTEYAGALTDHGNMYGFLEYYKGMKAAGKKPIVGFEAYSEDLDGELACGHLILLAKNQTGYENLLYLTSEAYDHFHKKPNVTWEMLRSHHEGLIATSACMGGVAQRYLQEGNWEKAELTLKEYKKIFGEDFYIEIQRHNFAEEEAIMGQMNQLASILGIKVIATTDSHYTNKSDAAAHECLLCLQTKKTLGEDHFSFKGTGYHIHNSTEMEELYKDMPEALDNTLEIADKCNVEVPLGQRNMPIFDVPAPFKNTDEYFEYICLEGFKTRYQGTPKMTDTKWLERFRYEIKMIKQMGFPSYFLIVWDFSNWAKKQGIYVGPGRGSAAGSLVAYCMGITDLDPIDYDLLFERFLNPERVSMPDIDMDFEHTRRQEVIDYVTQKYGAENVCHIVTFGTLAAKQSVKDMARVMGYPVAIGNNISKLIPSEPHMTLEKAMNMNPEFKSAYEGDPDVKKIVDMAKVVEGCKRNASCHPCGVVLSPDPIRTYLPASKELDEETGLKVVTSQVVGPEVEDLSLLKMDFLGLKNMTVIHDVIKNIKKTRGIDFDYHDTPLNDRATYEMLRDGNTGGVFQLESGGMTNLVTRMLYDVDDIADEDLDECFERLIAAVALYRPGPMDFIDDYISGMRDTKNIHYDHPMLESILAPTYGIIVYQEQVIQIVQKLAGFSLARADVVRKGVAKKKKDVMDAEKSVFLYGNKDAYDAGREKVYVPGCVRNGIPEEAAMVVWDKMEKFAAYAFNRSHAACYAYIAVITAYMRCHWTPEFYAAMCNAFFTNSDKLHGYLTQADKAHIKILPPDINLSDTGFFSDNGKDIRFGFSGLKGVKNFADKIVTERNAHGLFASEQNFFHRMNMVDQKPAKGILEALTWSGAMATFGHTKTSMANMWEKIAKDSDSQKQAILSGQISLFPSSDIEFESLPEANKDLLMDREHEMVGFYLTEHPVDSIYKVLDPRDRIVPLSDLPDHSENHIKTIGIISDEKTMFTKKDGRRMFAFTLADRFSDIRCVVFPNDADANAANIANGKVVLVEGSLRVEDEGEAQIIIRSVLSKDQIRRRENKVVVTIGNKEEQDRLLGFVSQHQGASKVVLFANGKQYQLKHRLDLTAGNLDWLQQNFKDVQCG